LVARRILRWTPSLNLSPSSLVFREDSVPVRCCPVRKDRPMPLSNTVAPHLPYLRRFARALAGTQKAGDAYVAATLQVLAEDPSLFDENLDARIALYRTFLGLWNSVGLNLHPDMQDPGAT